MPAQVPPVDLSYHPSPTRFADLHRTADDTMCSQPPRAGHPPTLGHLQCRMQHQNRISGCGRALLWLSRAVSSRPTGSRCRQLLALIAGTCQPARSMQMRRSSATACGPAAGWLSPACRAATRLEPPVWILWQGLYPKTPAGTCRGAMAVGEASMTARNDQEDGRARAAATCSRRDGPT